MFSKRMEAKYCCLVKVSHNIKTLKNPAQFVVSEIEPPWRRFHLKFPSGDAKWPPHERQRVVVKRSEKWSSSSLFSRARSRGLARSLCSLFRGGATLLGARWNQVSRAGVLPVPFTMATIVSERRTFRSSAWKPRTRVSVCVRVFARLRAVTMGASALARAQRRRCTQVARRCAARHLPARFLR